jgi:iron complex transport system substrate-binding protein
LPPAQSKRPFLSPAGIGKSRAALDGAAAALENNDAMRASRIVSLLPSCTEIVCALGGLDRLRGRSHECDFPAGVGALPVCTAARLNLAATSAELNREVKSLLERGLSIYEVDLAKLQKLRPDLILTQAQCEVCAVSLPDLEKALAQTPAFRPRILSLSPARIADVWLDIQRVAEAMGVAEQGREVVFQLKSRVVDVIQKTCMITKRPTIACLEWLDPLMAAGNWVPELVEFAGGKGLFGQAGRHSPWLEWETLRQTDPDIIVLLPCGFAVERTRREAAALAQKPGWKNLRAVKAGKVFVVDGNQYFNRPGPRLVDSLELLAQMVQPALFPVAEKERLWQKFTAA